MFGHQRYVRDLLGFAELRVVDADGHPITPARLGEVFQQPFDLLVDEAHADLAARPVAQVRVAVEVLRRLLAGQDPDEATYLDAALDALLANWGSSRAELLDTAAVLHDDAAGDGADLVASLADRLGVADERVIELLDVARAPDEDALEELFGLPSTQRSPWEASEDPPRFLEWQRDQLPDAADQGSGDDASRRVRNQLERTLEVTLAGAVATTESETLPVLRDLLVAAVAPPASDDDLGSPQERAAELLTRRLALDLSNSGQVLTTRLRQAAETLQTIVFGLRTGWFASHPSPSPERDSHPAASWRIAFDDRYPRAAFDADWHWLGRYEMWRSAARTLVHPDAALLPSLLDERRPNPPTAAYRELIDRLRASPQLTPRDARRLANDGYLAQLRDQLGDELPDDLAHGRVVLTDELTDDRLEQRRSVIRQHFERAGLGPSDGHHEGGDGGEAPNWLHVAPNWLIEAYYFVPMALGLGLQRAGHFLSALAWYRTVYAYDQEPERRKVFYGLVHEEGLPMVVLRDPTSWLRDGLDPHDIAGRRGHAYTRSTLQSIVGCFLDFADAEYASGTATSRARAHGLYLTALDLLELPELLPPEDPRAVGNPMTGAGPAPESAAIAALRQQARLALHKQRSGRNIAGLEQPGTFPGDPGTGAQPVHATVTTRPTIYRYRVLIERAKQLVGYAQQVEASFLSAAEKADAEAYNLLRARQDLALSEEQVQLADLRTEDADLQIGLAQLQRDRAGARRDTYQEMIGADLNRYERDLISSYQRSGAAQRAAAEAQARAQAGAAFGSWMSSIASLGAGAATASPTAMVVGALGAYTSFASSAAGGAVESRHRAESIDATVSGQVARVKADFARRKQEWRRQQGLARKDVAIGDKQIERAGQHRLIVEQEMAIAQLRADHDTTTLDFLANKFTNVELYEWMSAVLNRVYRFFLQQATAMALLAQDQLAFERQEKLPGIIRHDYWRPPTDELIGGQGDPDRDRRGLTGSDRLLEDIVRLDQFAFTTRERKLELSQTFSLAQLLPFEFEQLRQTGQLAFATPMELFDRAFPGHHLRLIKRVSLSVIALVPPTSGVRATLTSSGVSRVVVGPDVFRTVEVHRTPELIALTSPTGAGLFDLRAGNELLLPFEGQGVDTTWLLEMPLASNRFDFNTLSDVLFTIDYTAQHSPAYRRQVVTRLGREEQVDRPIHLRLERPDQWNDLHNSDPSGELLTASFDTRPEDFPPHLDELRLEHLLLCFVRANGIEFEVPVESMRFTSIDGTTVSAGPTRTVEGIISTRRANGRGWAEGLDSRPTPVGSWELALPNTDEGRRPFEAGWVDDIVFVVSFTGRSPAWSP